jgi:hypothetical protein
MKISLKWPPIGVKKKIAWSDPLMVAKKKSHLKWTPLGGKKEKRLEVPPIGGEKNKNQLISNILCSLKELDPHPHSCSLLSSLMYINEPLCFEYIVVYLFKFYFIKSSKFCFMN